MGDASAAEEDGLTTFLEVVFFLVLEPSRDGDADVLRRRLLLRFGFVIVTCTSIGRGMNDAVL